jgi:hypothetical protein
MEEEMLELEEEKEEMSTEKDNNHEEETKKGKKDPPYVDYTKNISPCTKFIMGLEDDFIIAHPKIPLLNPYPDMKKSATGPGKPHLILATDHPKTGNQISTTGNVGVMEDDVNNLAQMILEELQQLVGWDGRWEGGRRDISYLDRENADIEPPHKLLQKNMESACKILLPHLLPSKRTKLRIVCQAVLCPAPKLDKKYQWQTPSVKTTCPRFLKNLQDQNIASFMGFFPLTKEGMFVAIYHQSKPKIIFVPYQKVLLTPMQIPYVDELRTSILGSPYCKYWIYIIPEALDDTIVQDLLGDDGTIAPFVSGKVTSVTRFKDLGSLVGF